jgi:hypothetical protein
MVGEETNSTAGKVTWRVWLLLFYETICGLKMRQHCCHQTETCVETQYVSIANKQIWQADTVDMCSLVFNQNLCNQLYHSDWGGSAFIMELYHKSFNREENLYNKKLNPQIRIYLILIGKVKVYAYITFVYTQVFTLDWCEPMDHCIQLCLTYCQMLMCTPKDMYFIPFRALPF